VTTPGEDTPHAEALLETADRLQARTALLEDSVERLKASAQSLQDSTARLRSKTARLAKKSDAKDE